MSPIRIHRVTTTTILTYLFISIAVLLMLSYIIFQARLLIAGPQITLTSVPETVQNQRQITLSGVAQNITEITLNGRAIVTDETGNFSESLVLENGYTIVSIQAFDRYGRETRVEREFVYTPLSRLLN